MYMKTENEQKEVVTHEFDQDGKMSQASLDEYMKKVGVGYH